MIFFPVSGEQKSLKVGELVIKNNGPDLSHSNEVFILGKYSTINFGKKNYSWYYISDQLASQGGLKGCNSS